MNPEELLEHYKGYDVEYYSPKKIFLVRKPMSVVDFRYLRFFLNLIDKDIELIINGSGRKLRDISL